MARIKLSLVALLTLGAITVSAVGYARQQAGDREPFETQPAQGLKRVGDGPEPTDRPSQVDEGLARPVSEKIEDTLLKNAGIEDGVGDAPASWTEGHAVPGVEYIWSRDTARTGKASLCLKKSVRRYFPIAEWCQKVDHAGDGPRLKVSAWVKANQVSKAIVDAQFLDGAGEWSHAWVAYIGASKANEPLVTHDWKRYEGIVAIPPGTKQIVIAPQIYGPGTVWFDDLGAEYTHDPKSDAVAR